MTNKQKQNLLQYLGYYTGIPDDIWGPMSIKATEDFQRAYMEPEEVDGEWRPKIEARILEVIATGEKPVDKNAEKGEIVVTVPVAFWKDIRYFTRAEFRCTCPRCGGFPVEPEETMVRVVDEIRHRAGVPITIVDSGGSGIRCPEHNAEVGGVANSEHLYGRAADLHSSLSPSALKEIAEEVTAEMIPGRGGIGLYSWGIHVDTGKYSRWNG